VNLSALRRLRSRIDVEREMQLRRTVFRAVPVAHRSPYAAVIHVTVFKTASQWMRVVLSDPRVYRRSGLLPYAMGGHGKLAADPEGHAIGPRSLVLSMYANRETFDRIPKPDDWRVLVVARNPMDLLVSWHFSNRYTHPENPAILRRRERMAGMTEREALDYTIGEFGQVSDLLLPWLADDDPRVRLYRYEDLTGRDRLTSWASLMADAGIDMSGDALARLLHTYRQENMRPKRPKRDPRSDKYASGRSGSWSDVLTSDQVDEFRGRYGDLVRAYDRRFPSHPDP
jgi:hypothetical protein